MAAERSNLLVELLGERILVLDGAMGTMVHRLKLNEADVRGRRFADHAKGQDVQLMNFCDVLCLTHPDKVRQIHREYFEAGADIVETNSFGASRAGVAEFLMEEHVREINLAAAKLAREAADEFTKLTPNQPRFVAGSIGPTTRQLSIAGKVDDPGYRNATFDEMVASPLTRSCSKRACSRSTSTSTTTAFGSPCWPPSRCSAMAARFPARPSRRAGIRFPTRR
jgi:5-methyltetrahydrofolate--homocysteine methyltransferase